MLQVLLERGIVPDLIVGTSVGSWNGVWLAAHPTVEGTLALEDIWTHIRYEDIFPGGPVSIALHLLQHRPYLYSGEGVRRFFERSVQTGSFLGHDFEHLKIPMLMVATNLTRGRTEIFESGPLAPAVLASSAIPAVLPPVTINNEQYVDGGLLDNCGLRVAIERGARRIYVLDTSMNGVVETAPASLDTLIERAFQVVMAHHLQSALEAFAERAEVVLMRDEEGIAATSVDFRAVSRLIGAGRAIAERVLAAPERESAQSIQRRRAAFLPAWARAWNWEPWAGGAMRQLLSLPTLHTLHAQWEFQFDNHPSLPERLQQFARSLHGSAPRAREPAPSTPPVPDDPHQRAS
jgi:NTE family protein